MNNILFPSELECKHFYVVNHFIKGIRHSITCYIVNIVMVKAHLFIIVNVNLNIY